MTTGQLLKQVMNIVLAFIAWLKMYYKDILYFQCLEQSQSLYINAFNAGKNLLISSILLCILHSYSDEELVFSSLSLYKLNEV